MNFRKHLVTLAVATAVAVPMSAHATNGYFSLAYGAKSRGIAGASTALPQDTYAAAVNPAGMAFAENGADVGVTIFMPIREAESGIGGFGQVTSESGQNGFIIPSGGYVTRINDAMTAGITVYANGGMNTRYDYDAFGPGTINLFGAPETLGVDLAQLIFAPTLTYKINDSNTVGASLLVGYQRFKAYGLQNFAGFAPSGTTDNLTDQGYDDAWGTGIRVGWLGKLSENVTVGAAYSSKIYMDEFTKYEELFAEQGDFDIPANWSIGIAGKVTPKITLSADVQHIEYSDVKSIANAGPSTGLNPFADGQGLLGSDNGLGFGWDDMTIFKVGMIYEHDSNFTYRLGLSHGDQPIGDDDITFNIIAPAVIETHATAGFTWRPTGKEGNEITFTYMRAFDNTEDGAFPLSFGGGEAQIEMDQHAFDFQYTWKF